MKAECVAIEGFQYGRAVYSTKAAALKKRKSRQASPERVGLYGDYEPVEGVVYVRLVGSPNSCEELIRRPGVMMVLGYCHTDSGVILATPRRDDGEVAR